MSTCCQWLPSYGLISVLRQLEVAALVVGLQLFVQYLAILFLHEDVVGDEVAGAFGEPVRLGVFLPLPSLAVRSSSLIVLQFIVTAIIPRTAIPRRGIPIIATLLCHECVAFPHLLTGDA